MDRGSQAASDTRNVKVAARRPRADTDRTLHLGDGDRHSALIGMRRHQYIAVDPRWKTLRFPGTTKRLMGLEPTTFCMASRH
jgi:hypothetical protein